MGMAKGTKPVVNRSENFTQTQLGPMYECQCVNVQVYGPLQEIFNMFPNGIFKVGTMAVMHMSIHAFLFYECNDVSRFPGKLLLVLT